MVKWADVKNNVVDTIWLEKPEDRDDLIECGDDVFAGFIYANGAFKAPVVTPTELPYELTKLQIIDRLTDAELPVFKAGIAAASERARTSWDVATSVRSDHPLFATLQTGLAQAFGQDRAKAILARP